METAIITLLPDEEKLFELLRGAAKCTSSTVRVAGGWVRDRLLNKINDDIDITVDNMSGFEFAKNIYNYAKSIGISDISSPGEISANPEQRKMIPTGTIKIFGNVIEIMPLRKDVGYDELTRNPSIELVGNNPGEDARRRDFTVNSLFYNIHTGKVEDFVGGLRDLNSGIIRTPIDPLKSFSDDPLRILRAIRFSVRFGFGIDPETVRAIKNPKIQEMFKTKVPKEIITKELKKMLIVKNPERSARLLDELGLRDEIFYIDQNLLEEVDASEMEDWAMEQRSSYHNLNVWEHCVEALANMAASGGEELDDDERFVRNLTALLHDIGKRYRGIQEETPGGFRSYKKHDVVGGEIVKAIMRRLKLSNKETERVSNLVRNHMRLHQVAGKEVAPKILRRLIKDVGDDWSNLIDLSISDVKGKGKPTDPGEIEFYEGIRNRLAEYKEEQEKFMKPVLSGHDLMQMYGKKPGQWIGEIHKFLLDIQLENPDISKEEAKSTILERFPIEQIVKAEVFNISKRANINLESMSTYEKVQLAGNSNTPPETLDFLARNEEDKDVRKAIAKNLNTPPETLDFLARNEKDKDVRYAIAYNLNTPPEILDFLARNEEDKYVRRAIVDNPKISSETLDFLARNEEDKDVRYIIAYNLNTPSETLDFLARNEEDKDVRRVIAHNRNTSLETLDFLARNEEDVNVKKTIAYNLKTPPETLDFLARDEKNKYVRVNIARNLNTPPETFALLIEDKDPDVRMAAIRNPNLTEEPKQRVIKRFQSLPEEFSHLAPITELKYFNQELLEFLQRNKLTWNDIYNFDNIKVKLFPNIFRYSRKELLDQLEKAKIDKDNEKIVGLNNVLTNQNRINNYIKELKSVSPTSMRKKEVSEEVSKLPLSKRERQLELAKRIKELEQVGNEELVDFSRQEIQNIVNRLEDVKTQDFYITYTTWTVGQKSTDRINLVIQLNWSNAKMQEIKADPEFFDFYSKVAEVAQRSGHPILFNKETMGWARVDIVKTDDGLEMMIEEIQSDFPGAIRRIKGMSEFKGYPREKLDRFDLKIKELFRNWDKWILQACILFARKNDIKDVHMLTYKQKQTLSGAIPPKSVYTQTPEGYFFTEKEKYIPGYPEGKYLHRIASISKRASVRVWGKEGSGMLVVYGNEVLLQLRSGRVQLGGIWGIPGGAVKGTEGMYDSTSLFSYKPVSESDSFNSALEEFKEEGLEEVPKINLIGKYIFKIDGFRFTTFIVEVKDKNDVSVIVNKEASKWQWFPKNNLPLNLHPGFKTFVESDIGKNLGLATGQQKIAAKKPIVKQPVRRKPEQLKLDLLETREEKKLSYQNLKNKYNEYLEELKETANILRELGNKREFKFPTFADFIVKGLWKPMVNLYEQDSIDMMNPIYDGDGSIGFMHGVTGEDGFGYGTMGGQGPGGSYSVLSMDAPRVASINKKAYVSQCGYYKAKCPKCSRWVSTSVANLVARNYKIECPKHGMVKPKKFRMASILEKIKGR